jgi:hypothetical protein
MVSNKANNQGEEIQRETTEIERLENQNEELTTLAFKYHELFTSEQDKNEKLDLQFTELQSYNKKI